MHNFILSIPSIVMMNYKLKYSVYFIISLTFLTVPEIPFDNNRQLAVFHFHFVLTADEVTPYVNGNKSSKHQATGPHFF
jgi:hypothetical protein